MDRSCGTESPLYRCFRPTENGGASACWRRAISAETRPHCRSERDIAPFRCDNAPEVLRCFVRSRDIDRRMLRRWNRAMRRTSDTLAPSPSATLYPSDIGPLTCREGLCYLTSAIRALPTMTSGIPLVYSRTLFLTQSAACSLEANASSALSNMLMVISTSGPPSSR